MANFMTQMRVDRLKKELDRLDKKIEDLGNKKLGHSPELSGSEVAEVERHNANISSKITSLERRRVELQAELDQIPPITETDKLVKMYEMSYTESKSRKSELPDLKEFAQLKRHDPEAYMDKLDELAHMRNSIDAAYKAYKEFEQSCIANFYTPARRYLYMGEEIHDAWCKANTAKFRDPAREDRKWQFLSAKAIGWDEFKKDMKYASIVCEVMDKPSFEESRAGVYELYGEIRANYLSMSDIERFTEETNRWVSLSNQNDLQHLLPDVAHCYPDYCIEGVYDWDKVVGEPYKIKALNGETFLAHSDAAKDALCQLHTRNIEQAQERRNFFDAVTDKTETSPQRIEDIALNAKLAANMQSYNEKVVKDKTEEILH